MLNNIGLLGIIAIVVLIGVVVLLGRKAPKVLGAVALLGSGVMAFYTIASREEIRSNIGAYSFDVLLSGRGKAPPEFYVAEYGFGISGVLFIVGLLLVVVPILQESRAASTEN